MTTSELVAPDPVGAAAGPPALGGFVAVSEFTVPGPGRALLLDAFADRMGAVDGWPGFRGLQVWADEQDPSAFMMVSWWDSEEQFSSYMGSPDHRQSHGRIPRGEHRPRPGRFRRYTRVAS